MSSIPILRNSLMRRRCPPGTRIASIRGSAFHSTSRAQYAYKDDQSKDSLNPRSTEYSKSGSDNEAAQTNEAFDPNKTSPESQQKGDGHPLEMTPGNQEASKTRHPEEGGASSAPAEGAGGRERTSKVGGANKAGGSKSG